MPQTFDPFNDRTARDIRNSLSSALISELTGAEADAVIRIARQWERQGLAPAYQAYIRMAMDRYLQAENEIRSSGVQGPRCRSVVLWNTGLFFELHELLETIWRGARGVDRIALKGLIQAAGVYVHSQRGRVSAARGLAERARQNLTAGRARLGFIANLDQLLHGLERPSQPPPQLYLAAACSAPATDRTR